MAVLQCRMCGGDLIFREGSRVCRCAFCGSQQTLPGTDSEKKLQLFERANQLLFRCEFDKAAGVYENIIEEFPQEAEGYWGNLLCTYGIEYVNDPHDGRKVPTCHRSSFDSVMDDHDYKKAVENADAVARVVYREQAERIEEIRKGIIEVSGKEAPYDIFICYKETEDNGGRTIDSVMAEEICEKLTDRGYRVFFSRISLEDKLGVEYEPYIFAALQSAKVMLVFGTSAAHINSPWVTNEWSRYLKLMARDKSKHLIPCYKGMNIRELPKAFQRLQAQDMNEVGADMDLLRGIDKYLGRAERRAARPQADALLRRGYDALEDGAFDEGKRFFDEALNHDAESAEAYLGLFMADCRFRTRENAKRGFGRADHTGNRYWKRARQYAAGELAGELSQWEEERKARVKREEEEKRRLEERAVQALREAEEAKRRTEEELERRRRKEAEEARRQKEEEERRRREEEEEQRRRKEEEEAAGREEAVRKVIDGIEKACTDTDIYNWRTSVSALETEYSALPEEDKKRVQNYDKLKSLSEKGRRTENADQLASLVVPCVLFFLLLAVNYFFFRDITGKAELNDEGIFTLTAVLMTALRVISFLVIGTFVSHELGKGLGIAYRIISLLVTAFVILTAVKVYRSGIGDYDPSRYIAWTTAWFVELLLLLSIDLHGSLSHIWDGDLPFDGFVLEFILKVLLYIMSLALTVFLAWTLAGLASTLRAVIVFVIMLAVQVAAAVVSAKL